MELCWKYSFFIIADTLQLFLHVKEDALFSHEAAKYKQIKFWVFVKALLRKNCQYNPVLSVLLVQSVHVIAQ